MIPSCRAAQRALLGQLPEMPATLEQALTIQEMELIADIFDPTHRHRSRIGDDAETDREHALADLLYTRLLPAIRRAKFNAGADAGK